MNEAEVRFDIEMGIKVEIRISITTRTETRCDGQNPCYDKE